MKHHSCTQMRRCMVTHGTMNAGTGEHTITSRGWETNPCGAPLFNATEQASGLCRSCASGWTHPNNYPVHDKPADDGNHGMVKDGPGKIDFVNNRGE